MMIESTPGLYYPSIPASDSCGRRIPEEIVEKGYIELISRESNESYKLPIHGIVFIDFGICTREPQKIFLVIVVSPDIVCLVSWVELLELRESKRDIPTLDIFRNNVFNVRYGIRQGAWTDFTDPSSSEEPTVHPKGSHACDRIDEIVRSVSI